MLGTLAVFMIGVLSYSLYLQISERKIDTDKRVLFLFLDKVVIGSFRVLINFMLCYKFISMSIKPKNVIY